MQENWQIKTNLNNNLKNHSIQNKKIIKRERGRYESTIENIVKAYQKQGNNRSE